MNSDSVGNGEENQIIILLWLFLRVFFSVCQAAFLQAAVSQYELLKVRMYLSTLYPPLTSVLEDYQWVKKRLLGHWRRTRHIHGIAHDSE